MQIGGNLGIGSNAQRTVNNTANLAVAKGKIEDGVKKEVGDLLEISIKDGDSPVAEPNGRLWDAMKGALGRLGDRISDFVDDNLTDPVCDFLQGIYDDLVNWFDSRLRGGE